jgi:two-component system sensor histidine kinase/response regulator
MIEGMASSPSSDESRRRSEAGDAEGLDRAAALANVEGDAELLAEMARLFLEDCPKQLEGIRHALARGDARGVAEHAHAIKGSVCNFAAPQALDRARQLELWGREGDLARAAEALAELERALKQIEPALSRLARGEP